MPDRVPLPKLEAEGWSCAKQRAGGPVPPRCWKHVRCWARAASAQVDAVPNELQTYGRCLGDRARPQHEPSTELRGCLVLEVEELCHS